MGRNLTPAPAALAASMRGQARRAIARQNCYDGGGPVRRTQIPSAIEQGGLSAAGQLLPLVFDELRKLTTHKMAHPEDLCYTTGCVVQAVARCEQGLERPLRMKDTK